MFCGVVTFNVVFFQDCNCTLTHKADNTLLVLDDKIFCAPFIPEGSSFVINFCLLAFDILKLAKFCQEFDMEDSPCLKQLLGVAMGLCANVLP